MKIPVKEVARNFINQTFPDCNVAFLGGSAARGELREESDLDIIIIDDKQSLPLRQCFIFSDWKIESFVYDKTSLLFAFDLSRMDGIPTIIRICAESFILKDDGSAEELQSIAKNEFKNGPCAWPLEKQTYLRYSISDLLKDLNNDTNENEQIVVAYKLFDIISEFVLRANGYWLGYGKWMYRSLHDYDRDFCERFLEVFKIFMKTGNHEPLSKLIEQVLKTHGGRLFEGYEQRL